MHWLRDRLGLPEEYGDLVAFLCSERAAYVTGTVIPIDGGMLHSARGEGFLNTVVTTDLVTGREVVLDSGPLVEALLDRPLVEQYTSWMGGLVHGDLGDSSVGLAQGQKDAPVWDLISSPVKNSLILALVTALWAAPAFPAVTALPFVARATIAGEMVLAGYVRDAVR